VTTADNSHRGTADPYLAVYGIASGTARSLGLDLIATERTRCGLASMECERSLHMRSFSCPGWCVDLLSLRPKSTSINKRKGGGDGINAAVGRYLQDLEQAPVCAAKESSPTARLS
jgi:hypothetical protein